MGRSRYFTWIQASVAIHEKSQWRLWTALHKFGLCWIASEDSSNESMQACIASLGDVAITLLGFWGRELDPKMIGICRADRRGDST